MWCCPDFTASANVARVIEGDPFFWGAPQPHEHRTMKRRDETVGSTTTRA
jgi:hypothetical protein